MLFNSPDTLLRNRNFVLLWSAYAISALGDHLSEMALLASKGALRPDVDVTPLYARMTFLFFVPFFLFGPFTGMLADRFPRRGLMVLADLVRCGIMFLFPILLIWTEPWGTWGSFAPLLIVGTFAAVFSPARSALLPTLIHPDQLVRANALISGLGVISTMAAMKLGGSIADMETWTFEFRLVGSTVRMTQVHFLFILDGITFLFSALLLLLVIIPRSTRQSVGGKSTLAAKLDSSELREGFQYVLRHRRVLQLIGVSTVVWGCGALVRSSLPAIVRDVYGGTYTDIGNYQVYLGLGLVIGSVLLTVLGNALRGEVAITWGLIGLSTGILLLALSALLPLPASGSGVLGATAVVLCGTFGVSVMASVNAFLQHIVPNRFRGRVMGVHDLCTVAGLLLSTGTLGIPEWRRVDAWVGYILLAVVILVAGVGFASLWIRLTVKGVSRSLVFWYHVNEFWSRFWYRLERVGICTIPRHGAVIVAANHTSPSDPLLLSACCSFRPLAFMIAREFSNIPVARFFVRLIDCIPVNRDGQDTAATKAALRHLQNGGGLGIFIEGRITAPGETAEPRDGVALLAIRTGAAVIPAHISGTIYKDGVAAGFFARHRARVRFGPPVDLSEFTGRKLDRDQLQVVTRKIFDAIRALPP